MTTKHSFLLIPLLAGCYSYTDIKPAAAPPGTEVRARITGAALDRVAPALGSFDTRELTGTVAENRDGQLVLDVLRGTLPNVRDAIGPSHVQLSLGPSDFTSFEQRKLDKTRTLVLTGGILAGIGAGVAVALKSGGGGEPGNGPPEPPPINRIPVTIFKFVF